METKVKATLTPEEKFLRRVDKSIREAMVAAVDDMHGDAIQRQVIPMNDGHLMDSRKIRYSDKMSSATITLTQPYARRMYFGDDYNFQKVNHANAQSRWYSDYVDGQGKERVGQMFANEFASRMLRYLK